MSTRPLRTSLRPAGVGPAIWWYATYLDAVAHHQPTTPIWFLLKFTCFVPTPLLAAATLYAAATVWTAITVVLVIAELVYGYRVVNWWNRRRAAKALRVITRTFELQPTSSLAKALRALGWPHVLYVNGIVFTRGLVRHPI